MIKQFELPSVLIRAFAAETSSLNSTKAKPLEWPFLKVISLTSLRGPNLPKISSRCSRDVSFDRSLTNSLFFSKPVYLKGQKQVLELKVDHRA